MTTKESLPYTPAFKTALNLLTQPIEVLEYDPKYITSDVKLIDLYRIRRAKLVVLGDDCLNNFPVPDNNELRILSKNIPTYQVEINDGSILSFRYYRTKTENDKADGANLMLGVDFTTFDTQRHITHQQSSDFNVYKNEKGRLILSADNSQLQIQSTGSDFVITTTIGPQTFARVSSRKPVISSDTSNFIELEQKSSFPDFDSVLTLSRNLPPDQEGSSARLRTTIKSKPVHDYDMSTQVDAEYTVYSELSVRQKSLNIQHSDVVFTDSPSRKKQSKRMVESIDRLLDLLPPSIQTVKLMADLANNQNPLLNNSI